MKISKKLGVFIAGISLGLFALAGCSEKESASEDSGAEEIIVSTGNDGTPYAYLNEDDEFDGYDVQVVKAIDEKLEDYTFDFIGSDFPTALSNLESGKSTMGAYEYEENDERKEKFIYGDVGYIIWDTYIVTDGDQGDAIQSFDDLKGKSVYVTTGTNQAAMAENYLKENPDAFELVYGEYTNEQVVEAILSGKVDATLAPKYQVDLYNKNFGVNFIVGDEPVHQSDAYLLFNKKADQDLIDQVNTALQELKDEGKLKELSEEYLGGDYVTK
ncbi:MAG: transporter substrate-binding domain-containing protein [Streptococcaceae bacterium]|jgi:L-cystine transport system substrate-binding protein|nr:transporter substrate-binding domain-containing protein [Streptococcaceae bacterium]MCH4176820.1 transporter substrate-binding domain-containing protein [Streptococcaceae bacterium]